MKWLEKSQRVGADTGSQNDSAIEVRDKLAEVEVGISALEGRETLLGTFKQMKEDLIHTLKIERILRENKNIVDLNSEIFESSFTTAHVERNHERGNEYSQ